MFMFVVVVDVSYCVKDFNDRFFFVRVGYVKFFIFRNMCQIVIFDGINCFSNLFGRCRVFKNIILFLLLVLFEYYYMFIFILIYCLFILLYNLIFIVIMVFNMIDVVN